MAKGQMRSSKEAKKPKSDKPKGSVSDYKKSLAAAEKNGRSRQAAMSPDPISDRRGIGSGHHARRLRRWIFAAVLVDGPCGVKAEHRSPRDADAAARNNNENERAGGKAGTVDDDALAGPAQLLEKLDKRPGLASRAGFDPHLG